MLKAAYFLFWGIILLALSVAAIAAIKGGSGITG